VNAWNINFSYQNTKGFYFSALDLDPLKRALSDNPLLSSFTNEVWQKLLASTNPKKEMSMAIYEGIRNQLLSTRNGTLTTLLLANSSNQAGQWLHALPLPFAGLTMNPREYRTVLRLRTGHEGRKVQNM
jgi:hypothetical protein